MPDGLLFVLYLFAYVAAILGPLVLLPKLLDARGELPYNSVPSRVLAWTTFAALVLTISSLGPAPAMGWDASAWAAILGGIAFAAAWDVWDMRTRRIPRGRHPDR